jgi:predicted DNA-binding transcriptional regulator AlpA
MKLKPPFPRIPTSENFSEEGCLLTTREVARILGVTRYALEYWRSRSHTGPDFIKLGRLVRYSAIDLQRWLRRHTVRVTDKMSAKMASRDSQGL